MKIILSSLLFTLNGLITILKMNSNRALNLNKIIQMKFDNSSLLKSKVN